MSRALARIVLVLALGLACLALLGGCGSEGGEADGRKGAQVAVVADAPPAGGHALGADPSDPGTFPRVPITRRGQPVAVYAVKLRDLTPGELVRAVSLLTVTKCHHTDYDPTERGFTGCVNTRRYFYNPVEVETRFLLLPPDRDGSPDLGSPGVPLEDPVTIECTNLEHHCVPVNIASRVLASDDVPAGGADRWLVLELKATNPNAARCHPGEPRSCNVLALETQKQTAMYAVVASSDSEELYSNLPADGSPDTTRLPVISSNAPRESYRKVVYSVPLAEAGEIDSLAGAQLEAVARFEIENRHRYPPLISAYLVLADGPDAVEGRYLTSDSYDDARRGNTGANCARTCTYTKPAAATSITECDVRAGRRYVNLVADASRDIAGRGEFVRVTDGGFLDVVRFYEPDVGPPPPPCKGKGSPGSG